MTRAELVSAAQLSIAKGSRSFAMASRLFDRTTRERAWLLYAWCRACDDIADGQEHGGELTRVTDGPDRIARMTELTEAALNGRVTGEVPFDALGLVAAECRIPHALAYDLIEGFAMDVADWRPRKESDLLRYCYHVAGSVGCMMAVVMGVDPADEDTLDRASDLGIAFQLDNIARDLAEDDRAERCYLPVDWLVEADIPPGEHMKPWYRSRLEDMAWWLVNTADDYEASARYGANVLPFRARLAVLAAAEIYGGIGRKVVAAGAHAWDHRVSTTGGEKLAAVWRALGKAQRPAPFVSRDGLWTRPRDEKEPR